MLPNVIGDHVTIVNADDPRRPGSLSVSWRMIAFACALLAAGSTGTLAIVVPVKNVDTLSTIALALAILAFVIQIIVFVVQSWTSGQQMLQSQAINSDTRSLLTELKESAQSTNQLLANQYDKILERLLVTTERAVTETSATGSVDLDELRSRLERELRHALHQEVSPTARETEGDRLSSEQRARLNYLETYPKPQELIRTLDFLEGLSPQALSLLHKFGRDAMNGILRGNWGYEGFYRRDVGEAATELERHELIAVDRDDRGFRSKTDERLRLTRSGLSVVRPLIAVGRPPTQAAPRLLELRRRAHLTSSSAS